MLLQPLKRFLGVLFFQEATPLIRRGCAKSLEVQDLPRLPTWLRPANARPRFSALNLGSPWRFLLGILTASGRRMLGVLALVAAMIASGILVPVAMKQIINELQQLALGQGSVTTGLWLTLAFSLILAGGAVLRQHYFDQILKLEQFIVSGLNDRIYSHALRLTRRARQGTPVGDIVNHMGTDSDSVAEMPTVTAEIAYGIGVIAAVTVVSYQYIGVATFAALATLAVLSPLCQRLAKRFIVHDDEIMKFRDLRVSLMSQVISGIRVVKFLTWENRLSAQIDGIRAEEIKARKRLGFAMSKSVLLFLGAQGAAHLAALATYVAMGNKLDAATVFAVVTLFDLWQHPFAHLTNYIADLAAAKVGAQRLSEFLRQETLPVDPRRVNGDRVPGLCLANYSAFYDEEKAPAIEQWNLSLAAGTSTAIVGPVGAGKTTFLASVLGELTATRGSMQWAGLEANERPRVAWVPQAPYVINGTVRDNILLSGDREVTADQESGVERAVATAGLGLDVARMPAGLATELGEQGINLSGGQKQRLSLARAIMQRPTVALLDDPFSAVDKHTEKYLMDELILGEWKGITRIVTTHRLDTLGAFDRIVLVMDGKIRAVGSLEDLLSWSDDFKAFYAAHQSGHDVQLSGKAPAAEAKTPALGLEGGFIVAEDRENGSVPAKVYGEYLKALGGATPKKSAMGIATLVLATIVVGLMPLLQNWWLAKWMRDGSDVWRGLRIYALLAAGSVAFSYLRHLYWNYKAIQASRCFHDRALASTLKAPVRFFDVNPVGRILNRFSFDVDAVERHMATAFEQMGFALGSALLTICFIVVLSPWTVVVLLPALALFYRLQDQYRKSARETKRLNSVTRSPRFAHFKETLEGLDTIRAHGKEEVFWRRFDQVLTTNQQSFRAMVLTNRWFSSRLPVNTTIISLASVAAILYAARLGLVDQSTGALLLFYNFLLTDYLNWTVRAFSEAESRLTSVERLLRYGRIEPEQDTVGDALPVAASWPAGGTVEFDQVHARYAPGLPEVLRGISFSIPAGTKAGIMGRTGAGKSSLIQVLYRFLELEDGEIRIDGMNIANVPKERLRKALAIIPQNPTLFQGTLRENLDRFVQYHDDAIWSALAKVQLADFVRALPGGLETPVLENGANFSEGQKQLFCLARALLSDAKVIIMDEATASVDVVTDQMIQSAIKTAFADRTMLIIAHRLGTIQHCDLILELEQGALHSVRTKGSRQEKGLGVPASPQNAPARPRSDRILWG